MVSFESFGHMLRFAKEVDAGLLNLEEKLKNPAKLLYCDREENARKAAQCLDSLEKELDCIQEEVNNLIVSETKALETVLEERDKITEYLTNIDEEMKNYENKMLPYGYRRKQDVVRIQENLCTVENEEPLECSLENSTKKVNKNVMFVVNQTNLNRTNKSFLEYYTTPKCFEPSEQSSRNKPKLFEGSVQSSTNKPKLLKGSVQSSINKLKFFNGSVQSSENKPQCFEESVQSSTNKPRLSEEGVQSSRNKIVSKKMYEVGINSDTLCTPERERKPLQLINDIAIPKFNRALFKENEICTPPDPGFSYTSRQVYSLSVNRIKQKKLAN